MDRNTCKLAGKEDPLGAAVPQIDGREECGTKSDARMQNGTKALSG
jgi:hypothetical protein